MSTATKRVIPADIFDALEFSALANGGIGGNRGYEFDGSPCCIGGHAIDLYAAIEDSAASKAARDEIAAALLGDAHHGLFKLAAENDAAVRAINRRNRHPRHARVSWEEYVQEMGWERAES